MPKRSKPKSNGRKKSKPKLPQVSPQRPGQHRATVHVIEFLRVPDVAQALGLHRGTVLEYIHLGIIPATRIEMHGRKGWWKIDPAWIAERQAAGWPYVRHGPQRRPGRPRKFPLPSAERSLELPFPKGTAGT